MGGRFFENIRIAIRGGGDLGSGVAFRLVRCGFPVLVTELAHPLLLRRAVAFGSAAIEGKIVVEGVTARRVFDLDEARHLQANGEIPVLIDPDGASLPEYDPVILIDARMRKKPPGESTVRAPLVIGLGPGFSSPENCDVVIETNRGHNMGRAIYHGHAEPDSGQPGAIMGHRADRVLRAPADGMIVGLVPIGTVVTEGQALAMVGDRYLSAPFSGVLRGLIHDGVTVTSGLKVADIDPRGQPTNSFTISEKALAVGGGVLEAVLSSKAIQEHLMVAP